VQDFLQQNEAKCPTVLFGIGRGGILNPTEKYGMALGPQDSDKTEQQIFQSGLTSAQCFMLSVTVYPAKICYGFRYFAPCQNLLRSATLAGSVTKFALRYIREPTRQFSSRYRKNGRFSLLF
jgi:hypothetical protein